MFIRHVFGEEIQNYIVDIAALRLEVFKDFPYLYDGNVEDEHKYLERYSLSKNSLVLLAFDNDDIVGASTALPLQYVDLGFKKPFENSSYNISDIFYFGESVLLPQYRGNGIGNKFFQEREKFALSLGYNSFVFCAVNRGQNHSLKPNNYRDLGKWWSRIGYQPMTYFVCNYSWKEVNSEKEVMNSLTFWQKGL